MMWVNQNEICKKRLLGLAFNSVKSIKSDQEYFRIRAKMEKEFMTRDIYQNDPRQSTE